MAEKQTELFHCMWRKEAIPQEFKDASIIHLYKRKGNPQVCDNHRVQVGKDQEKAQSEKDSHSKNQGGKKPN